jgi:hypothetical protein
MHPSPSTTVVKASGGRRRATQRRQSGRHFPGRSPGGGGDVAGVGRRIAEQKGHQLTATSPTYVLDLGLRLRVALDRIGGELVDVGEDRLGEQRERLGTDVGATAGVGEPTPRHPRADPVGGLQGIEGAAGLLLAATEGEVDLASRITARVRVADHRDELGEGLADAAADPAPEAAVERPGVLGDLAGDRLKDLGADRLDLPFDQVGDPRRQVAPRFVVECEARIWHLDYKF